MATKQFDIEVWSDQMLAMMEHIEKKLNPPFVMSSPSRICCYVACPLVCGSCCIWSTIWRIFACPFMCIANGCHSICSNNGCTNVTDACIDGYLKNIKGVIVLQSFPKIKLNEQNVSNVSNVSNIQNKKFIDAIHKLDAIFNVTKYGTLHYKLLEYVVEPLLQNNTATVVFLPGNVRTLLKQFMARYLPIECVESVESVESAPVS